MGGVGFEHDLGNGYAIRADLDLYDKDAQLATLSLMKRFGVRKEEPAPAPEPEPAPPPPPVEVPPVVVDGDADGILDPEDACPDTAPGQKVDAKGCDLQEVIVLKGVTFATNSAELIGESPKVLDEAYALLSRYPAMKIEIAGHTDSDGSAVSNKKLSQRRAESVRAYLVSKGAVAENLVAKGYGEEVPVADNRTKAGKALNRRVEMHILQ